MKKMGKDYRDVLEPGRGRKLLVYRALGACVLAAALMLGLGFFGGKDEPESVAMAPIVEPVNMPVAPFGLRADKLVMDAPDAVAEPMLTSIPVDVVEAGTEADDDSASLSEGDVREAVAASEVGQTPAPVVAVARPTAVEVPAPAPRPAAAPTTPQPAVVASRHVVRVGDFSDPASRLSMRDEIEAAGHRALVQSRVAVGPFPDKAAAEAARRQLERDRRMKGLVIRLNGGGHAVQLGVFSDADNADAMQARLQAWGYKVHRDARLLVGPFAERKEAETVAGQIMLTRGENTQIITGSGR